MDPPSRTGVSLNISKSLTSDKYGLVVSGVDDCIKKGRKLLYGKEKIDLIITLEDGTRVQDDHYLLKLDEDAHILLVSSKPDEVDAAVREIKISEDTECIEAVLKKLKRRCFSFDALACDDLQLICDADVDVVAAGLDVDEDEALDLQLVAHENLRLKVDTQEAAELKKWITSFDDTDSQSTSHTFRQDLRKPHVSTSGKHPSFLMERKTKFGTHIEPGSPGSHRWSDSSYKSDTSMDEMSSSILVSDLSDYVDKKKDAKRTKLDAPSYPPVL